jgi:arsenate reductase
MSQQKKKVLFLCTHNAVRSQIAEGLLRSLYGKYYEVYSAGVDPYVVHSLAVEIMKEIGIDISKQTSKSIEEFRDTTFDVVVTVCDNARETCPFFPGKMVLHKGFDDPGLVQGNKEQRIRAFRTVRDQMKSWIEQTFGPVSFG